MQLNGWQRIGIVISVLWVIVGSLWALHLLFDPIYQRYFNCVSQGSFCNGILESELADARSMQLEWIAFYGLAPIPLAWLTVYMVIGLVRWIRAGSGSG